MHNNPSPHADCCLKLHADKGVGPRLSSKQQMGDTIADAPGSCTQKNALFGTALC